MGCAMVKARASKANTRKFKSGLEEQYAQRLHLLRCAEEIAEWAYEPMRLRIGDGAWYTPDFVVILPSGEFEIHETKGFMREAARVRLQAAATLHPWFQFFVVRNNGGAWQLEPLKAWLQR